MFPTDRGPSQWLGQGAISGSQVDLGRSGNRREDRVGWGQSSMRPWRRQREGGGGGVVRWDPILGERVTTGSRDGVMVGAGRSGPLQNVAWKAGVLVSARAEES